MPHCTDCGAIFLEGAKFCPGCGCPQSIEIIKKKTPVWPFVLGIAAMLALCLVGAFCRKPSRPYTPIRAPTRKPSPLTDLHISSCTGKWMGSLNRYLYEGEIENTGTTTWRFVEIRVTVKKSGQQVGSDTGYIDSDRLPPGALSTWKVYVASPMVPHNQRSESIEVVSGRPE